MLTLVKLLRDQGNMVVIEPDDGHPVEYLFRKGFRQFFADPAVISFGMNVAASIVGAGIVGAVNWVWQHRRRENILRRAPQPTSILLKNNDGSIFSYSGEPLHPSALDKVLKMVEREQRDYSHAFTLRSSSANAPIPIFLEHTTQIVGWCNLDIDDRGICVRNGEIKDHITWRKVESGELKGLSITGIASKSICSVCGRNYVDCNHITGIEYESSHCTNGIKKAIFINVNLVSKPVNPDCYLQMIKSAKNNT
jgi:hypothetical protein